MAQADDDARLNMIDYQEPSPSEEEANLAMAQADDDARLNMIIKSQAHLRKRQTLPWLKMIQGLS